MSLDVRSVECFSHSEVGYEPVDDVNFPFPSEFFRRIVPVAVTHNPGQSGGELSSPSSQHGRSYELVRGKSESVWTDQFGNPFQRLSTKGNNFSKPELIKSATAPSGYIPYGLQEGDALLRTVRASRLLREAGVDTEWIVRVEEPKHLLYEDVFVVPGEYKRLLISDMLGKAASNEVRPSERDSGPSLTIEEVAEAAQAVDSMDFFVTLRATAEISRIAELNMKDRVTEEEIFTILESYNSIAPFRKKEYELQGLPDHIDVELAKKGPEGADIVQQFFSEILPKLMGSNLAKMHKAGFAHMFPHLGNFTTLGGIVDLDSVKGLGLDIKPTSDQELLADIAYLFSPSMPDELSEILDNVFYYRAYVMPADKYKPFYTNLLRGYVSARYTNIAPGSPQQTVQLIKTCLEIETMLEENYDKAGRSFPLNIRAFLPTEVNQYVLKATEAILDSPLSIDNLKAVEYIYEKEFSENLEEILSTLEFKGKVPFSKEEIVAAAKKWFGVGNPSELIEIWDDEPVDQLYRYQFEQAYKYVENHEDKLLGGLHEVLLKTGIDLSGDKTLLRSIYYAAAQLWIEEWALDSTELPTHDEIWEILGTILLTNLAEYQPNTQRKLP